MDEQTKQMEEMGYKKVLVNIPGTNHKSWIWTYNKSNINKLSNIKKHNISLILKMND